MRMQMWCRYHHIIVDRLRTISVRLWIKTKLVSVLVDAGPELASINSQHDISDSFSLNYLLIYQVVHQILSERYALLHISFLHFQN